MSTPFENLDALDAALAAASDNVADAQAASALVREQAEALYPTEGGMRVGASMGATYAGRDTVPVVRAYLGPGDKPSSWSGNLADAYDESTVGIWLSIKTGDAAWLETLLSDAPPDRIIIGTVWHEPENDDNDQGHDEAGYHRDWDAVLPVMARYGVIPATVLMGSRSRDQWERYYRDDVVLQGFDRYNPGIQEATSYRDPSEVFAPVLGYAAEKGKPLAIGETGVNIVGGDVQGRAEWAAGSREHLAANGCVCALWWDSKKCALDAPTAAAWLD